ncbi:MAG: FAD-dependent oxidoreductase [Candidatus Omnitrophica bacterium]|nr:FAD-dependent oxidoreductase [Candidatus Omnitrophota bacterium]
MKKTVILGAGLTGLSAAYNLQKIGEDFVLFEKENVPGGLCRSIKVNGFVLDYAERFLRVPNPSFKKFILDLMGNNINERILSASIFLKGKHIEYPLQNNLFDLPEAIKKECLKGYLEAEAQKKIPSNFAEWINASFGAGIAKYFMLPYNEKIWSYKPGQMAIDWFAKEFMPRHDFKSVKEGAELPLEKRRAKNIQMRWYPHHGGAQAFSEALYGKVDKGSVHFNKRAKSIDLVKRRILFSDGSSTKFDKLISTMPLNELVAMIMGVSPDISAAAKRLKYNSVICLNYSIDKENVTDRQWIYFPEKRFVFSRLYFLKNFCENSVPKGKSVISALMTYSGKKFLKLKEIKKRSLAGLREAGIAGGKDKLKLLAVQNIKYGFAIPTLSLSRDRAIIQKFLRSRGVFSVGRYGNWEYSGMEHALMEGEEIAKEVGNL